MDVAVVLIWSTAIICWWYIFCLFNFIRQMRKAIARYQEIITLLEGLPDEVYSDEFMWGHVQDVVEVHDRMAETHKVAAFKWERRSNPLNLVRRRS